MIRSVRKRKRTLAARFVSMISILICLILAVVGLIINNQVRDQMIEQMENKGETLAKNIAANSAEALLTGDDLSLGVYVDKISEDRSVVFAMILDDRGAVLTHSDMSVKKGFIFEDMVSLKAANSNVPLMQDAFTDAYGNYIDVTMPMMREQKKIGSVRIGFSRAEIEQASLRLRETIIIIACGGLLLGIVTTWILASRITEPLKKLTSGVEIVGGGNLDFRINLASNDEIGQLADTFNQMTGKLKEAQKELVEQARLKQELQIAQQIQTSLLPSIFPKVKGYDIQAFYKAAKEVGGDYFDFVTLDDDHLGIVIADVSGKGVPGSLGMVVTRSIFRMQALAGGSAGDVMKRTNDLVYKEIKRGIFVTMFYAILDIPLKRLNCACAGHNPPILYHGDSTRWVRLGGLALGIDKGAQFNKAVQETTIQLSEGDFMFMYTDGVSEAMNAGNEEFGDNRLASVIRRAGHQPLKKCIEFLNSEIEQFVGSASQSDDITVVGIKAKTGQE